MSPDRQAVGGAVRAFYEASPFPEYDDFDTPQDLVDKARRGVYARALDDELPLGIRVLDAGCGTGQLAAFLSLTNRSVIGADFSRASLSRGQEFKARFGLSGVRFVQMDLFAPALRPGIFDVVMSNGVLHHTADPEGAFRRLVELVRPGGYMVVGLYNHYGRCLTHVRRLYYRLTGRTLRAMMWPKAMGERKRLAWLRDQYEHPHERSMTVDEVLRWFARARLEYVSSVPPISLGGEQSGLFAIRPPAGRAARVLAQLGWIVTLSSEGGYFVTIGRKAG